MNFSNDPRRNHPLRSEKKGTWKKRSKPKPALKIVLPKLPSGYKWHGPRIIYDWPTRIYTGEPLGLDIGGFKFDDSDAARWEFLPKDLEVTTTAALLRKFRQEWRWWKNPIMFVRNPEKEGKLIFGIHDVIVALYPKGFYIIIERYHREIYGPHAARLFYRSYQVSTEVAWVAIHQLEAYWYSDERMLKVLNHAAKNRKFWHSPATASTIVLQ